MARICTMAAVCALAAGIAWGQVTVELQALPSTERAGLEGPIIGTAAAEIACARNEVESFQIVATPRGGTIEGLRPELSPLTLDGGGTIPAGAVTLYRAMLVPVRKSSPRAPLPQGLYPDPLAPVFDPDTGDRITDFRRKDGTIVAGRFNAGHGVLWDGQHAAYWVDVAVPANQAPGVYTATFTLKADGAETAAIPVRVEVWDFALPDGPTHENHFGGFGRVARQIGMDPSSEEWHAMEMEYLAMLAAHRINPPIPDHLKPAVAEDGSVSFSPEVDEAITDFVNTYHVTNIQVPRAPFGDTDADRPKAVNFYRTWYAWLEGKGWAERAYLYMLDEPNELEAYERVLALGAVVAEGAPQLRRLVVEQTYTQNPDWPWIDPAVDIWCPLFGFVHEPSIKELQAGGDDVWSYTALVQRAPGYHPDYEQVKNDAPPFWQIDYPLMHYRIAPWLNRRYGITGLLYWSVCHWDDRNPWDDPGFRVTYQGEGSLFYPGSDAGIDGPIASMRLKNLRDGMEDYEYFALLAERGGAGKVDELVRDAVPAWGSWDQDGAHLQQRRRALAEAIVAAQ